ncbi:MAG TPA: hypothetical protein VIO86_09770 [Candidatus Dormibacteraeota bacterium]
MNRSQAAQTLVALALFVPLVLVPVAGYAVEATLLATRASLLQAAVARAAEDATQALDVSALRSSGVLRLDPANATRIARASLAAQDSNARLGEVTVGERSVTVRAHDEVPLAFGGILQTGDVRLASVATARLTAGYRSPSSRVALPKRSLSMTG